MNAQMKWVELVHQKFRESPFGTSTDVIQTNECIVALLICALTFRYKLPFRGLAELYGGIDSPWHTSIPEIPKKESL